MADAYHEVKAKLETATKGHAKEAAEWDEQHARQHEVNTRQAKENG